MVLCPSCSLQQQPRLTCEECGAPLPVELDCFAALGIARRLVLDPDELERVYHELGRRVHPDRFANRPAAVRDASLRSTALLTRSYRTLRDPVSRGLYWLELNGEKLAENNKRVPPELAELVFDVQEELARLRDANGAEEGMRERMVARNSELERTMREAQHELAANFARWDQGGTEDRGRLVAELKTILSRIAYLRTLIRDVGRTLEPFAAI